MQKYHFGDIVTFIDAWTNEERKGIIEYSYAEAFGGRDTKDYSVCELTDKNKISHDWSWLHESCITSVDTTQREQMIEKVRKYHRKQNDPFVIVPNAMAKTVGYK